MIDVQTELLPDMVSSILCSLVANGWKAELSAPADNHLRISARRRARLGAAKPLQCLNIEIATKPEPSVRYVSVSRDGRHGRLVQTDHMAIPVTVLTGMDDEEFDTYATKAAWR